MMMVINLKLESSLLEAQHVPAHLKEVMHWPKLQVVTILEMRSGHLKVVICNYLHDLENGNAKWERVTLTQNLIVKGKEMERPTDKKAYDHDKVGLWKEAHSVEEAEEVQEQLLYFGECMAFFLETCNKKELEKAIQILHKQEYVLHDVEVYIENKKHGDGENDLVTASDDEKGL